MIIIIIILTIIRKCLQIFARLTVRTCGILNDKLGYLRPYCIFCLLVKDHLLQQRLLPYLASSLREVPMVPNRLTYVPSKRTLPLQSPEQIHRSSQESSRRSPNSTLRDKLGPPHQPKETIRPQPSGPSILKPTFPPQFMKDLNNHSVPLYTRSNRVTESKVILSSLGGESITAQRQESNKVLSFYVTHWNSDSLQCSVYGLSCSLAVPSMLNNSWSWSFLHFDIPLKPFVSEIFFKLSHIMGLGQCNDTPL